MSTQKWSSHIAAGQVEDVQFLLANGIPLAQACARVGLAVETYEKRIERKPEPA